VENAATKCANEVTTKTKQNKTLLLFDALEIYIVSSVGSLFHIRVLSLD
jgi:hypothetical protein